mmetsp:Transcript_89064/g.178066  ORF Transcript_89064/g.178066 Transcript_89064/m.178066 type:complete len:217 (-) Transcript_89064:117-767(-)
MSDDSSDEDVPLGQLLAGKKSASPAQKIVASKKKQDKSAEDAPVAKKNKVTPAKKVKAESKSAKPDPKPAPRAKSGTVKNDCDVFYDTVKGQLVQKLECRWWYAIVWPSKESLSKSMPPGYQELDGFRGVYICVKGDSIGKVVDNRDPKTCPNFRNLKKKDSKELLDLLKKALETQKEQLIEHEGSSSPYESTINNELKWVSQVNCVKADKEAARM